MRVGVLVLVLLLLGCGLPLRLSRPLIRGQVFDEANERPLPGVTVEDGDHVLTDDQGRFELPAQTYREWTWVGREAPPLHSGFRLSKLGYLSCHVQQFSPTGGASSPTAPVTFTVRLRAGVDAGPTPPCAQNVTVNPP